MTEAEKFASPKRLRLYVRDSILFNFFFILCFFLGTLLGFSDIYFFTTFAAWNGFNSWSGYIIRKYGILDQVDSQASSKPVRDFIILCILTFCLFWTAIAGLLVGLLFFFVSNHIFL